MWHKLYILSKSLSSSIFSVQVSHQYLSRGLVSNFSNILIFPMKFDPIRQLLPFLARSSTEIGLWGNALNMFFNKCVSQMQLQILQAQLW